VGGGDQSWVPDLLVAEVGGEEDRGRKHACKSHILIKGKCDILGSQQSEKKERGG